MVNSPSMGKTKIGEWLWRFLAIVMTFSVGWTVWIIYQLNPPPLIMNAAFEAAAKAKVRGSPAEKQSAQGAMRETLEEAGARIELMAAFSMIAVPYVNQVHLFYRARLLDLEFKPGDESLEVALFEESRVPWKDIAFRTVGLTLKHWFADRSRGAFNFHAEDIK